VGPRNHVLDGGQAQTSQFAVTWGDNTAMRPFARLLWTLVIVFFFKSAEPSYVNVIYYILVVRIVWRI